MAENEGNLLAGLETAPVQPAPVSAQQEAPASPAPAPAAAAPAATTSAPAAGESQADWRARMAGGDKEFLKTLEKFTDESQVGKAYREMVRKMSSGELKPAEQPYPETGTDEQKAAWRKARGVPDKPEVYLEGVKLPNGIVPGEADKPGLERLAQKAIQKNWSQDQYNAVLEAYYSEVEASTNARDQFDDQFHRQAEDNLRQTWGNDYRRNVEQIHNFLNGQPAEVRERLFGGRTSDGKLIGDDPQILQWLADTALAVAPQETLTTATGIPMSSRLQQLEAMVKDANSEYYTGVNSAELRHEYFQLLEMQEKKSRGSRAA